ncbi:hypothetical protein [Oxalicibacterium faecigallinarum]|uniref:Uncharacterized protein n=1 Tax=Oxalicibacterium faecigallinarum TaxID=573741 RepID=A0A8J3F3I5_9BURK|nr:hypothetical protein [Oxalicibacterium faecigallinarum]GGI19440.1 hypothetical protein GCM10008066_19090 [Oxalicibacterium faecigallinarum]
MEKSDRKQSRISSRRQGSSNSSIRQTLATHGTQFAHITLGVRHAGGPDYRDPENRWVKSDHPNIAA